MESVKIKLNGIDVEIQKEQIEIDFLIFFKRKVDRINLISKNFEGYGIKDKELFRFLKLHVS